MMHESRKTMTMESKTQNSHVNSHGDSLQNIARPRPLHQELTSYI
jgi:hypothetical protein